MNSNVNSASYLNELGFYPHLNGYGYLAAAIDLVLSSTLSYYAGRLHVIKKLSEWYDVSPNALRRSMDYSINTAWNSEGGKRFRSLFSDVTGEYPPSVSEFVGYAAVEIMLREAYRSESEQCAACKERIRAEYRNALEPDPFIKSRAMK